MIWTWTPHMRQLVRQRVLEELVGGRVLLNPAKGAPIATATLAGERDTLVVRAGSDGRIVQAVIESRQGDVLASAPGSAVCDRTDVQMGAEVTVRFALG